MQTLGIFQEFLESIHWPLWLNRGQFVGYNFSAMDTPANDISLDSKIPNSLDTLRVLLTRFTSMAWSTSSVSILLSLPDVTWLSMLLQLEPNFLKYLLRLHISRNKRFWLLPRHGQFELVKYILIWAIFKSHTNCSNARRVSAQTTTILLNIAGIYQSFNSFVHRIYQPQTSMNQNIAILLVHPSLHKDLYLSFFSQVVVSYNG